MKFVVDTNIVFSSILNTNSKIGDLILNSYPTFEFVTCETLQLELSKHREKLIKISKTTADQVILAEQLIVTNLQFISDSTIPYEHWILAVEQVKNVDMNDVAFVALSHFIGAKLWTGDMQLIKGLVKNGNYNFITTNELLVLREALES